MNIKQYFALAALILPTGLAAQTIDFETQTGYTKLDVFDTWEDSPFRKGELTGNVKVIANPFSELDPVTNTGNSSEKVLAFQRSRFASNTFGARISLSKPIALSPTTQYVHVKIHKPKAGRTMLIGLGARADRPWQSKEVVQFTELSTRTISPDQWEDAVFAISGANGVNVHSLVVAADLESTHDLDNDFMVCIDDIIVNDDPTPSVSYDRYPINADKTAKLDRSDRYTSSISLTSPSDGSQTLSTNQKTDKLLFQDLTASQLRAKAGESVTASLGYSGSWMHGYVYLDRGVDGQFSYDINTDGTPTSTSDLMTYSYYEGKNSAGTSVDGGCGVGLTGFTIPTGLANGFYRMRFKVDWNYIDPAGNTEANGNSIVTNGGVIVDTRLNVHGDKVSLTRGQNNEGTNGEILDADGKELNNKQIAFNEDYTIKAQPANGFKLSKVVIRHGYNLDGDSLLMGTRQWSEETVAAYLFTEDNQYTIPAKYVDGDVRVTPFFSSDSGSGDTGDDYARNFSDDLAVTRTDRHLDSFSMTGTVSTTAQTVTVPSLTNNYVYRNLTESAEMGAVPGETLTFALNYTGHAMHPYLYIDYNNDGHFDAEVGSTGIPTASSELVTYSYYKGYNSKGTAIDAPGGTELLAAMPSFVLPELPVGMYRARLKIDWDNIDPAGQWSEGGSNQIDQNGGQVVDFLLNVHNEKSKLAIETVNGSVVGASNTGQPDEVAYKTALTLLPVAAADGYTAEKMVIRHGQNLDGDRYDKHGNRQWSEYEVSASGSYAMPADSVNGNVRVSVAFADNGSAYKLAFSDEFNGEDGSQPNAAYWTRCGWNSPTWKRYTAQTTAGQAQTGYIEDGKLVLRCVANTFDNEVDGNGKKLEMISGAVESSGKIDFTYGKVEGRLKTIGHSGNFPAFWMMPKDGSAGWPYCGEIDIWEQIDNSTTTYHTIHSKWANGTGDGSQCMGQGSNPQKSGSTTATLGQYHTFGFEWTESILKWFVDGKQVFSYAKSTKEYDLNNGQWPFDKAFYLILNQSVGNGSWAQNRDLGFTYETQFDWVRVYQKEGGDLITGINTVNASLDFYAQPGKIRIVADAEQPVTIYNTQGSKVYGGKVQGNVDVPLAAGVYIVNGQKLLVP